MNAEQASIIALQALQYIARDESLLRRFVVESGLDLEAIRAGAKNPDFQAGVLDFLLANEPVLIEFCEAGALDAHAPARARGALAGNVETP